MIDALEPGTRVRITRRIERRGGDWEVVVIGQVVSTGQEETGSWFAHSPSGKLMLTRLHLRKDDGELTSINLDPGTQIEILEASDEGGFTVYVPSLPGCISEGQTRDEAMENIREAIELYLESLEDDLPPESEAEIRELVL